MPPAPKGQFNCEMAGNPGYGLNLAHQAKAKQIWASSGPDGVPSGLLKQPRNSVMQEGEETTYILALLWSHPIVRNDARCLPRWPYVFHTGLFV